MKYCPCSNYQNFSDRAALAAPAEPCRSRSSVGVRCDKSQLQVDTRCSSGFFQNRCETEFVVKKFARCRNYRTIQTDPLTISTIVRIVRMAAPALSAVVIGLGVEVCVVAEPAFGSLTDVAPVRVDSGAISCRLSVEPITESAAIFNASEIVNISCCGCGITY